MKTILFVDNSKGFGGSITSLIHFMNNIDRDKFKPVLTHSLDDIRFKNEFRDMEAIYTPYPKICNNVSKKNKYLHKFSESSLVYILCIFLYAIKIVKVLRLKKVDLVHLNNDINSNIAGIIAAKITGIPAVLHERNVATWIFPPAKLLLKSMAAFIAISEVCKSSLVSIGVHKDKIHIVHEGLDFEKMPVVNDQIRSEILGELNIPHNVKIIMIAGVIMPWKGQNIFIEAAKKILDERSDYYFIIVGEVVAGNEDYFEKLQHQISGHAYADHILFTGFRSDVFHLMQIADVIVHCSLTPEPFGRVIIEAMFYEKPIISTTIGAPAEIIEHGATGYLVQPGDPMALKDAICDVLQDHDKLTDIGRRARKRVMEKYSIELHARRIQDLYSQVLLSNRITNLADSKTTE